MSTVDGRGSSRSIVRVGETWTREQLNRSVVWMLRGVAGSCSSSDDDNDVKRRRRSIVRVGETWTREQLNR